MSQRNGWTDEASRWLIHRAARQAPDALAERLEEEWLADLTARSHGAARLRFALGCCWATRVIAYEHEPARVAGAVLGSKLAIGNAAHSIGYFSRRSTTLLLVITLHAALFYVLMTKLSHTHYTPPPPPFDVTVLKPPAHEVLPLPPIPTEPPRVIHAVIPEFPPVGGDDTDNTIVVTEKPVDGVPSLSPQEPLPPVHVMQRVEGGPGAGFPNAEDYYPDSAKRLGEQGVATVQVCVDVKGRTTSDPTTSQSTGSARLDEGALKLARAASGHYRAATEDGRPVNSCYPFRIRFMLKN